MQQCTDCHSLSYLLVTTMFYSCAMLSGVLHALWIRVHTHFMNTTLSCCEANLLHCHLSSLICSYSSIFRIVCALACCKNYSVFINFFWHYYNSFGFLSLPGWSLLFLDSHFSAYLSSKRCVLWYTNFKAGLGLVHHINKYTLMWPCM